MHLILTCRAGSEIAIGQNAESHYLVTLALVIAIMILCILSKLLKHNEHAHACGC